MAPLSTKFSNLLVVVLAVPAILLALDADINVAAAPFNRMQRRSAFLAEDSVLEARAGGPEGGREHHPHNRHDGQGREGHPHNHNHDGHGMHSSEEQGPTKREFLEHEMNLIQRDPNGWAKGAETAAHIVMKHHHNHYDGGSNQNQKRDGQNGKGSRGGERGGERGGRGGEGGRGRKSEGRGGRGHREGGHREGNGRGGHSKTEGDYEDPAKDQSSSQPHRRAIAQPSANVNGGTKDHLDPSANPAGAHAITNEIPGQENHRTHSNLGQERPDDHRTPHSQLDREALGQQTSDRHPTHQPGGSEERPDNYRTPHSQLGHEALDQQRPNSHSTHRKPLGGSKNLKKPAKKPTGHRAHLSQHHRHPHHSSQQQKELHPQQKGSSKSGDSSGGKSFIQDPHKQVLTGTDVRKQGDLSGGNSFIQDPRKQVLMGTDVRKQGDLSGGKSFIQDPPKQGLTGADARKQGDFRSGTLPSTSHHDTVTEPQQANPNAAARPHRRSSYSYFDLEDLD